VLSGESRGMLASLFAEFDEERRRIEGALHDGVQQDLAALAVQVQLANQLLEADPGAARRLLEELEQQAEDSLERVRALAREIYPSALPARGLGHGLGRYPLPVEEAVYFAARALGGSPRLWEEAGMLRLEIEGGAAAPALEHARARIEAVGGQLVVSEGSVSAAVPLSSSAR
jgi:signal transduction histidine kinase